MYRVLADTTKSGELYFPEFALALYLCNLKLVGRPLPSILPYTIKNEVSSMMEIINTSLADDVPGSSSRLCDEPYPWVRELHEPLIDHECPDENLGAKFERLSLPQNPRSEPGLSDQNEGSARGSRYIPARERYDSYGQDIIGPSIRYDSPYDPSQGIGRAPSLIKRKQAGKLREASPNSESSQFVL